MNRFSIYDAKTGLFTGSSIACIGDHLPDNVPPDCGCVMGEFDHLSQKVDMTTGEVIDYIPPQPSVNHAWNSKTKRWLYVKTDGDIAAEVRAQRDQLITACDWVSVRAIDNGAPAPAAWLAYRSALRDITKQSGFPRTITWPAAPN